MAVKTGAPLRVVLLKPSKYWTNGVVERYRRGFMPIRRCGTSRP